MEAPAALYMEALTASRRSRGMQPGRAALDHGAMEITKKIMHCKGLTLFVFMFFTSNFSRSTVKD